jgi:hypothetical protein
LKRAFETWLQKVVLPRLGLPEEGISVTPTLEEFETMLAESIDRWNRELREEGLQEGLQKGEARILLTQLRLKFGPLKPEIEERVRSADPDRLVVWSERVLGAERAEDVLQD